MILSNVEIQKALDDGCLVIDPEPTPRIVTTDHPYCPFGTTSVDLRLGDSLSIPEPGPFVYDLRQGGIAKFLSRHSKHVVLPADGYILQPKVFVLGTTLERVSLPIIQNKPVFAARIEGKSSFARCGLLVHFTAPTVHAGFEGKLTLEMINLGVSPILLVSGMTICQLIFEIVSGDPQANPSQFQGQATPSGT
jgi:dCTP deaminase